MIGPGGYLKDDSMIDYSLRDVSLKNTSLSSTNFGPGGVE